MADENPLLTALQQRRAAAPVAAPAQVSDNPLIQALEERRASSALPTGAVSEPSPNPLVQALRERQLMDVRGHWAATAPTPPLPPWQRPTDTSLPRPAPDAPAVGEEQPRFFERRMTASKEEANPLVQALQERRASGGLTTTTEPVTPVSSNPLVQALQERRQGLVPTPPAAEAPKTDANAPWYGQAWDWLNKPLFEFNPENKGGFIGGAEDVASGFTSPLSIG